MKKLEHILLYLTKGFAVLYLFIEFPLDIFLLLIFFLSLHFLQFLNYYKFKKDITKIILFTIPKRNIFRASILITIFIIGLYLLVNYYNILIFRSFSDIDIFILILFVPLINIISSITFSDLSDNYSISTYGLISGYRFNDYLLWTDLDRIVVNHTRAEILLLKNNKVLLKMKINKNFFSENVNKIVEELNKRIISDQ